MKICEQDYQRVAKEIEVLNRAIKVSEESLHDNMSIEEIEKVQLILNEVTKIVIPNKEYL